MDVVGVPGATVLTETLTPTFDSYVDSSAPDANFGEGKTIQVGSRASEVYRAFLNFDLSNIPEGAVIQSATLLLQTDTAHAARPYDIAVSQVSAPWVESTVTWNNQPRSQPTISVTRVDGEGTKFSWNVTVLAQKWVHGAQNHGLSLQSVTEHTGADLFHEFGARTPRLFATQQVSDGDSPKLIIVYTERPEVTVDFGDPTGGLIEVDVTLPGEDGNSTTTTTTEEDAEAFEVPPGATVHLTVRGVNINGAGPEDSILVRNVNNFLDTNRHMANLGPIFGLEWRNDRPDPSVLIHFQYPGQDIPLPAVAAFRQAEDGNWLQVTPVLTPEKFALGGFFGGVNTWFITDVADLSVDQNYNYSVLAFSPTSYEVLGFWEATPLAAQQAPGEPAWLSDRLAPADAFPDCAFQLRLPNEVPWGTSTILLKNGWQIQVSSYRVYQNCPGVVSDIDHLYGQGRLQASKPGDNWTITFADVATDATGTLARGRILLAGDGLDRTPNDQFVTNIGRIEFSPRVVNAEAIVELPRNIKLTNPAQGRRSNRVFGIIKNVRPDLSYDALSAKTVNDCDQGDPGGIYLVDENLPWRIHPDTFVVDGTGMTLDGVVCTRDRLGYKAPNLTNPPVPDNNLGFLRTNYRSGNATVSRKGLNGTFSTPLPIAYTTSLPAGTRITSLRGAEVGIDGSRISGGNIIDANVVLDYFNQGTDSSYMSGQAVFSGHYPPPHGQGIPGTSFTRLSTHSTDAGGLAIGRDGVLNGEVALDVPRDPQIQVARARWPGFVAQTSSFTFYAAAAAFGDDLSENSTELSAPMPAENAWRQLPGPFNGDLDPGFNIIRLDDDDDVRYDCYNSTFRDADMDLYVRRGGVSENLRINAAELGQIRDASGYLNTFSEFDVVFIDNAIIERDVQIAYYLPYPSDVTFPLTMTRFDEENCPVEGILNGPRQTLLHKYWNMEVTPSQTVGFVGGRAARGHYIEQLISAGMARDEANNIVPGKIMRLNGRGAVNGLVQNRETPGEYASLPMTFEWLPDGDYGRTQIAPAAVDYYWVSGVSYALSGIKLSHYYNRLMDPDSAPDPVGMELGATAQSLPSHLLNADGRLTRRSLKDCSERDGGVGCGFVVLEGEGAVKYFGEIQVSDKSDTPGDLPSESPRGNWPLAVNFRPGSSVFQTPVKWPQLNWAWAFDDDYLNVEIPVLFLANGQGGVLAGLSPDSGLLPDAPVAETPASLVFTADFGRETVDDFGIFVGYSSSLAVLRALAMNQQDVQVRGWDPDLEAMAKVWSKRLGYPVRPGEGNDVVDLAKEIWPDWRDRDFQATIDVLEPIARGETGLDLAGFGISGVNSGDILNKSSASLTNGLGRSVLIPQGGDFIPSELSMDTELDLSIGGTNLFSADWLPFSLTRDKQFLFEIGRAHV